MGMDVYAQPLFKESEERKNYERKFETWVAKRDQARAAGNKEAEQAGQRMVERYYNRMYRGRMGYFRVNYNPFSLSWWLEFNVEKGAKGDWGLAIFYDAIQGKAERVIDDDEFRERLLATARRWYEKALSLKDRESLIHEPEYDHSGDKLRRTGAKTHQLNPKETNDYIDWLKELVDFAEVVAKEKCAIEVSA